ncbi:hypothetical protein, variant [Verruconis gallopava]|nr:hypothetical protein, variant [Verruconis gallopava]KIW04095.1 hypothetical protein, variant [Verruconis gallopava]
MYEYINGRPDDAFITLASVTRLAYCARIHICNGQETQILSESGQTPDSDLLLLHEEAVNTWWGIVICERIFLCEAGVIEQPTITVFPDANARLPIEPQVLDHLESRGPEPLPNIPVSCITSPSVGAFGRTVQAACLLDQVLKATLPSTDIDSRLLQLDRLDANLQSFLTLMLPKSQEQPGLYCTVVHIAMRALFTLHGHILDQKPQVVRANFQSLEQWQQRSREALDTVTKMALDILQFLSAAHLESAATPRIDAMPPMYPYVACAALDHLHHTSQNKDVAWLAGAVDLLRRFFARYYQHWTVGERRVKDQAAAGEKGDGSAA